jgi:hypothetical protein
MVYIDFLESVLLDGRTQDVTQPRARGFNTKDKEQVTKYLDIF